MGLITENSGSLIKNKYRTLIDKSDEMAKLNQTISKFNKTADESKKNLAKNPFSERYKRPVHKLSDERYGRPEAGSLTEKRGIRAGTACYSFKPQNC